MRCVSDARILADWILETKGPITWTVANLRAWEGVPVRVYNAIMIKLSNEKLAERVNGKKRTMDQDHATKWKFTHEYLCSQSSLQILRERREGVQQEKIAETG